MNVEAMLSRLLGVRRNGSGWRALCPAHADKNPSLSIDVRGGRILVHCHAGCSQGAVLAALGIETRELFHDAGEEERRIIAEYAYTNEDGELLFQVVRFKPKGFRQRRPDGRGNWIWKLGDVRRVLYHLPEVLAAKAVLIVEGEKDVETARNYQLTATCNACGAGKWREENSECLHGKRVAIIADADESGRKHALGVAASLHNKVESLKVLELPGAKDLSEWVEKGGTRDALLELIRSTTDWKPQFSADSETPLVALPVEELLAREIKPREMLLDPILPEQGLAMLYAYRGVGKTYIALGIAAAVASGGSFLRWMAPRPRRVLYVDGELPAKTLQERSAMILAGLENVEPAPGSLQFITPDIQQRPIPDLATPEGQRLIEPHLEGIALLVLDNLSALCRYGKENEGEGWLPVQEWALALRRRGISVLFVHHAGKNFAQRGTSRREDLLDMVFTLKRPANYNPSEGLRCEVHFEKTRGMLGDAAKAFEVQMEAGADGRAIWTLKELEDAKAQHAVALYAEGMSVRDVAEELGISKSTAHRIRKKWMGDSFGEVSHRPTM
jgi:AAA domain/Homeodomain-like domain